MALLLLGVGLVFLALAFFSGQEAKKSGKTIEAEIKRVTVVIANTRIPFGQQISSMQLETQKVAVAPSGAFSDPAAVIGKTPLYNIEPGTPITNKFFEPGAVAGQVRDGFRAFALRLDDNNASTAKIKAGDYVDVFSLFRSRSKEVEQTVSRLVQPKLRVLAVGEQLVNTPEAAEEKDDPRNKNRRQQIRAITVEIETAQVNSLALAQDQGELFVVIRAPTDEDMPDTTKYPSPQPVLQPLKKKVAGKEGPTEKAPEEPLSPMDAAYAGIAFEDVVLPGSAEIDKKNQKTQTKSSTRTSRPAYSSSVEVIRAGEASKEKAR